MNELPSHIFIVGVPRSGTSFINVVLKRNQLIHISSEIHYFSSFIHNGFQKVARNNGGLTETENVRKILELGLRSKIFGVFWRRFHEEDARILESRILESGRTYKEAFDILLRYDAEKNKKIIPGDKTPSNIYHISKILQWFPDAKVIQIIRNPVNILASEINKPKKPDYPLNKKNFLYKLGLMIYVSINWNRSLNLDNKYKAKFPENYCLIKYETLKEDHEETVKKICAFLGMEFSNEMLNPPVNNSSFKRFKNGDESLNTPRIITALMKIILRSKMKRFGYS